jgi:hypothetical protein
MLAFEDETTITQKPCIRKSMFFEGGEQQKIEHTGTRKKFSLSTYPRYGRIKD